MAILSFSMLCFAMLTAILGRRSQIVSALAILIAGSSLSGVERGSPATGLHVAAYVVFGVTWVAAFSGEIGRQHRAFSVASIGLMASFALLALAMWADVGAFVLVALGLVVVMFVSAVILGVRGNAQDERDATAVR